MVPIHQGGERDRLNFIYLQRVPTFMPLLNVRFYTQRGTRKKKLIIPLIINTKFILRFRKDSWFIKSELSFRYLIRHNNRSKFFTSLIPSLSNSWNRFMYTLNNHDSKFDSGKLWSDTKNTDEIRERKTCIRTIFEVVNSGKTKSQK